MLVLTASAAGNIFTAGHDTLGRRLEDAIEFAVGETAAIRGKRGLYQFTGQRAGNKDRLTRVARQSIAAVDCLLDAQLHPWLM